MLLAERARRERLRLVEESLRAVSPEEAARVHSEIVGKISVDWKHPDYDVVEAHRALAMFRIRDNPLVIPALKSHYKNNPADFISDWGYTVDPRNVERGLPSKVPFLLFPKQRDWIEFVLRKWKAQEPGLTEKSRDMGLSWLAVSLSATLCLFYPGMAIGFGSRKEEYVDKIDAPKSLFYKARKFMDCLPVEFNGGWNARTDSPHLRLNFRATESHISGEAGDNIGRGDRASIYFVDEAAHLERPQLIEASLSQTTNCRQDISSVNGSNNPFAEKRHTGKVEVFIFDWRDDPRKDDAWYQKQVSELDPVTVAQEINRDYSASVEGILIPSAWVRSAIDAHLKLGISVSGVRTGSLDVADEGVDLNAFCGAKGILIDHVEEWTGRGGDIYNTVERAFLICDTHEYGRFKYDADGLGAGVRGDARVINERRKIGKIRQVEVVAFRGSEAVFNPEGEDVKGRKNQDFFANRKAQAWWALRARFQATHRAVAEKQSYAPDDLISLSGNLTLLGKLITELSQPTYSVNAVGKIVIDKAPEGSRSPNLADTVMIQFSTVAKAPMNITNEVLAWSRVSGRR